MPIELKKSGGNLSFAEKMLLKGDAGGYYIPSVDEAGNLTWTPTEEEMAIPEAANIRGPKGEPGIQGPIGETGPQGEAGPIGRAFTYDDFTEEQLAALTGPKGETGPRGYKGDKGDAFTYADFTQAQLAALTGPTGPRGPAGKDGVDGKDGAQGPAGKDGEPGVYVGATAPTDDSLIWINPEGEANEEIATKKYVDDAIAAAGTGGGGGSADLTNYYTKSEVDGIVENIALTPGPAGKDGEPGKDGVDGKDGEDYVLTAADKTEIANLVLGLLPAAEEVLI